MARLRRAVGAIAGGILREWSHYPSRAVFQSFQREAFTGALVGYRQFIPAVEALSALGFVAHRPGIRFTDGIDWDDGHGVGFDGRAARFRPTMALLTAAAACGVVPDAARADFGVDYPTVAPRLADANLIALRPIKQRHRPPQGTPPAMDRVNPNGAAMVSLRNQVREANDLAASHEVTGCTPPRWTRSFRGNLSLFGRWTAAGVGNYQNVPTADRQAMKIDGEPVAEVDVRGSHLTIMHGLLGLPAPMGDPYDLDGVVGGRDVVKAWITITLGKGSPAERWPAGKVSEMPALASHTAREVGAAVCARYPFLRRPAEAVASLTGLDRMTHLGTPRRLLTLRLMALEAEALTLALTRLWARGVFALPLHDAVVVPVSGEAAARVALRVGFGGRLRVIPELTVSLPVA